MPSSSGLETFRGGQGHRGDPGSSTGSTSSTERAAWTEEFQQWKKSQQQQQQQVQQQQQQQQRRKQQQPQQVQRQRDQLPPSATTFHVIGTVGSPRDGSNNRATSTSGQRAASATNNSLAKKKPRPVSPCIESTAPSLEQLDDTSDFAPLTTERRDDERWRASSWEDNESPIPDHFIACIQQAFGTTGTKHSSQPPVDLYRDVFDVPRNAGDRELRIAYFKRGREVLSSTVRDRKQDARAKRRFQAVSMAYEILTTAELRSYYDEHGLSSPPSDPTARRPPARSKPSDSPRGRVPRRRSASAERSRESAAPTALRGRTALRTPATSSSQPSSSAAAATVPLRRSRSQGPQRSRSRSASRSIRWNEQVEELVYERDPAELLGLQRQRPEPSPARAAWGVVMGDPPTSTKGPKPLRKVKRKVILEAQELARELEALQENKSDNLVSYFLDDLEASLDGLEASVEGFVRFAMGEESADDPNEGSEEDGAKHQTQSAQQAPTTNSVPLSSNHDEDETSIGTEDFPSCPPPCRNRVSPAPLPPPPSFQTPLHPLPSSHSLDDIDSPAEVAAIRAEIRHREPRPGSSKILQAFDAPRSLADDCSQSTMTSGRARAAADPTLSGHASVRERTAFLAAAVQATSPQRSQQGRTLARLCQKHAESRGLGDPAQSLFDDLTKPAPWVGRQPNRRSEQSSSQLAPADDEAYELFRNLTKPPPSGYEKEGARKITALIRRKSREKRAQGPYAKSLLRHHDSSAAEQPFDPFAWEEDRENSAGRLPPGWIYDSPQSTCPGQDDDEMTAPTVSTMSASEATAVLRDRLFTKTLARRAMEKRRRRSLSVPLSQLEKLAPTAVAPRSAQATSPVAVQSFDETFDVVSGWESHDADVVKLDRTRGSALSSLTGHASTFTAQQEHAWRDFCRSTSKSAAQRAAAAAAADPPLLGSPCAHPTENAPHNQDFVSQIMVYMKAFTDEVDKVGLSISNLMTSAVAVPEDDVQGVLNVLSQEMESTVASTAIE